MKKGFTMVEMLAVISILSVLLMLIVPNVFSYISNSKEKTYLLSISNIYKMVYNKTISDNLVTPITYVFDENKIYYEDKVIDINEKIEKAKGIIKILSDGSIRVIITDGNLCVTNDNLVLKIDNGKCTNVNDEILKALTDNVYRIGKGGNYTFSNGKIVELDKKFEHSLLQSASGSITNNAISIRYNNKCAVGNNNEMSIVSLSECG